MYLKASANPKFDPAVQTIQMKLNAINIQVHGNWPYLQADGLFGEKTKQAVKAFQVYRNITPISSPKNFRTNEMKFGINKYPSIRIFLIF